MVSQTSKRLSGKRKPFLRGRRIRRFEALQKCLIPLAKEFSDEQRKQSQQLINQLLHSQPKAQLIKLRLFVILIDAVSIIAGGRTFRRLSTSKQERILNTFCNSSVGLIRKGFWGLNTLAKLGVYGQESVYSLIHYKMKELSID